MSAGRLPASETVPVALIEPPPPIAAEALRIVTVSPSMAASSATLLSRRLASGSTTCAPDVETVPLTAGFFRLPEIDAAIATVPDSCVPRSARKRLASDSGARPLIVMFVPAPARSRRPLAAIVRPAGALALADDSVMTLFGKLPAAVALSGDSPSVVESGRAETVAADVEVRRRLRQRAGYLGGPGDRAAKPLARHDGIQHGKRKRFQVDVESQRAAVERNCASCRCPQPFGADNRGIDGEPLGVRGSLGVDVDRAEAGLAKGRGSNRPALQIECDVRRGACSGDRRAAVDRAAEREVGTDRIGDRQRQCFDRDRQVQLLGNRSAHADLAAADIEQQIVDGDILALDLDRRRRGQSGGQRSLLQVGSVEPHAVAAVQLAKARR